MIFEIAFNNPEDNNKKSIDFLKSLGVKVDELPNNPCLVIELNTFEELETLLGKIDRYTKRLNWACISFDDPCIYIDHDI